MLHQSNKLIPLLGPCIPLLCRHLYFLAGASHHHATKSYLSWCIPSPAPHLILAGTSSSRHHSFLASASLPHHNFYLGWRIIAAPQFLSWPAHHCHAVFLSRPAHHCHTAISFLADASSPCRHILSRPAHHRLVRRSDCKPIFSSAAPLCAVPASTKESSSCPLVTIPPQANLLFSRAIVRRSANNPLTPLQHLSLRLSQPSQLDCCHLPAPASPLQDAYARQHHVERRGVVQGILNRRRRETVALCIIAPCQQSWPICHVDKNKPSDIINKLRHPIAHYQLRYESPCANINHIQAVTSPVPAHQLHIQAATSLAPAHQLHLK